jgi:hypothetical protein
MLAAVLRARPRVRVGQYPIVTPVRVKLKANRTYGLSVYGF